jgi:hypothetical protein
MAETIRCKLRLEAVIPRAWGGVKAIFRAQYDETIPEDRRFEKATPCGTVDLDITNPHAIAELVIGGAYYFDMIKAETEAA